MTDFSTTWAIFIVILFVRYQVMQATSIQYPPWLDFYMCYGNWNSATFLVIYLRLQETVQSDMGYDMNKFSSWRSKRTNSPTHVVAWVYGMSAVRVFGTCCPILISAFWSNPAPFLSSITTQQSTALSPAVFILTSVTVPIFARVIISRPGACAGAFELTPLGFTTL